MQKKFLTLIFSLLILCINNVNASVIQQDTTNQLLYQFHQKTIQSQKIKKQPKPQQKNTQKPAGLNPITPTINNNQNTKNTNNTQSTNTTKTPDFGPYMRELQTRIKRNWNPPKGNESKRVVLIFRISRSGRLLSIKTLKSSGSVAVNSAAINAVELTAPFKPLPSEYNKESVDIQFTFDYNVFGTNRY